MKINKELAYKHIKILSLKCLFVTHKNSTFKIQLNQPNLYKMKRLEKKIYFLLLIVFYVVTSFNKLENIIMKHYIF